MSTPVETRITLTFLSVRDLKSEYDMPWDNLTIYNERDITITPVSQTQKLLNSRTCEIDLYIMNNKERYESFTIVPLNINLNKTPKKLEEEYFFIKGNGQLPKVIDLGEIGKVSINSFNKSEGKITINCSSDSPFADVMVNSIMLIEEPKKYQGGVFDNFNGIWFNRDTFDKLKDLEDIKNIDLVYDCDINKYYEIIIPKALAAYKFMDELKIEIPSNYEKLVEKQETYP